MVLETDMDIDQLLEAPYVAKRQDNGTPLEQTSPAENRAPETSKPPHQENGREIETERSRDKDKDRNGHREREKDRERRDKHRSGSVERKSQVLVIAAAATMTTVTAAGLVPETGTDGIPATGAGLRTIAPGVGPGITHGIGRETGGATPKGMRAATPVLSDWERDKRTVFVAQLAARCTTHDLEEFFAAAGKVREARLITDRNSRRSKGVGYVEFYEEETVKKALAMTGQKLLGIPIDVQITESEKNRLAAEAAEAAQKTAEMSYNRLYVGSLHFNITEEDLKTVFEPFGPVEFVNLHKDPDTGKSKGFAFVQYENADDAKVALDKMNGYDIMGRKIRVGHITDKTITPASLSGFSLDESEAAGFALNSASRAELMAKLARDDMPVGKKQAAPVILPTRCVLVKNMFDPAEEEDENWDKELEEDVKGECSSKYGKVVHIAVEKDSPGNVYMKFNSIPEATAAVEGLNGRFFGGKQLQATYVVEAIYTARHPTSSFV
ncbi:hypothetical protein HK097_002025 [Rhizophlyctis rosea]|uniref:Splicing factor, CC1-like protein n=1 Tax=Rhizophlyctis rosea TaxID=64517 RepID=A0AAD5X7Z6_9FUNG|nr:hypothetical protein HK097_002025 [Rhizophlyctis rosea]